MIGAEVLSWNIARLANRTSSRVRVLLIFLVALWTSVLAVVLGLVYLVFAPVKNSKRSGLRVGSPGKSIPRISGYAF